MGEEIPKEILEELDIGKLEKSPTDFTVTAVVEPHQVKLPIPKELRKELELKKGKRVKVHFNKDKGELIYKI